MLRLCLILIFVIAAHAAYETDCTIEYPIDTIGWISCTGGTCSMDQLATIKTQSQNILLYNQPRHLVALAKYPGIVISTTSSLYLQTKAAASLKAVLDRSQAVLGPLRLNGALRSAVEHHVIYQWSLKHLCGKGSMSPDEEGALAGLVINISSPQYAHALEHAGWKQIGTSSYEYSLADIALAKMRSQSIKTFQALYNQNVPWWRPPIRVTGVYDDATGAVMDRLSTTGFSQIQCLLF